MASADERERAAGELCLGGRLATVAQYTQAIAEGCSFQRFWRVAVAALAEMRARSLEVGPPTAVAVLSSFGASVWRKAVQSFCDFTQGGLEPTLATYRELNGVLEHTKRWAELLSSLSEMQRGAAGTAPGLQDYSMAMAACSAARKEQHVKALAEAADLLICRSQVSDCEQDVLWERAIASLAKMLAHRLAPQREEYAQAVGACARAEQGDAALELVRGMRESRLPLDEVAHSAAIVACARGGMWEQAVFLLQEMRQGGLAPTADLYEAVIAACGDAGQWEWAVGLLGEMVDAGERPSAESYASAIRACEKDGQWQWALDLLDQLERAGHRPTGGVYQAVIAACRKGGQDGWVQQLLSEMAGHGLGPPDLAALRAASLTADGADRWRWCVEILRQQRLSLAQPSAAAFAEAVHACSAGRRWLEATALLAELTREALLVDAELHQVVITACGDAGQWQWATALLAEMRSLQLQAGAAIRNSVIMACQRSGERGVSVALVDEMQEEGMEPDIEVYNAVINTQAELPEVPAHKRNAIVKQLRLLRGKAALHERRLNKSSDRGSRGAR